MKVRKVRVHCKESLGKVISLVKMKAGMADTSHGDVQGGVHDAEKKKAS